MAGVGRTALLVAAIAIIMIVTLTPAPVQPATHDSVNVRGVADALVNVLLFMPFGIAAALRFGGVLLSVGLGTVLSTGIELGQLVVPGRYASVSDVVFNTVGTAVGAILVQFFAVWARPRGLLRWVLPMGAVSVAVAVLGGGAFLHEPAFSENPLYGQWTAEFGNMAHYEGRVMGAFVGMMPVPSHRIATSNTLRHRLLGGEAVRVEFIAGPPPVGLAPIFSIFDDRAQEMFLLGADSTDVVVRFRTRARQWHLDERDLRVPAALANVAVGDRVSLRFWREQNGYCLGIGSNRWCKLGYTMADSWGLLLYPMPYLLALIMPYAWLIAVAFPAGFWLRTDAGLGAVGLIFALLLAVVPQWAHILSTPSHQFVAALSGGVFGSVAGRLLDDPAPTEEAGNS